jgi:hypothetical protein
MVIKGNDHPAWTAEQTEALYAGVYAHRDVCPGCGGKLAVVRSDQAGVFGEVRCDACGASHVVSGANDPLRGAFREYTEQERKAIVAADRRRESPACPVDGTPMDVHVQRSLGLNSNVVVRCRRCSQSVQFRRLHG